MSAIKSKCMILRQQGRELEPELITLPEPGRKEILIEVGACAVCRTDLHVIDGDLKNPLLPLVPGHEIVGRVLTLGSGVDNFSCGDRVAVPWLASTCLSCRFCKSRRENLCNAPVFTGYTKNGGYSQYCLADANFCFKLRTEFSANTDEEIAPLLCAGLIGWRSFKFASREAYEAEGRRLGIYGFGAAGHLVLQIARHFGWRIFVFTRKGDKSGQEFASSLGADWVGDSESLPPEKLDAGIIFAPAGQLVPAGLEALEKGGILVCGGIHMSRIPAFSYDLLWGERSICSVANLTRADGLEFLELAPRISLRPIIKCYKLEDANAALSDLRDGKLEGAAVLSIKTP